MKLGMIMPFSADSFEKAKELGLDFVEFDLNHPNYWGVNMDSILPQTGEIKAAMERTGVAVGGVGRWGSQIIAADGSLIEHELDEVKKAIDFAASVGCENYLVSCNYAPELTYYKNLTASINVLNKIVEYAKQYGITVSIVNCMMGNNYIRTPEQWKIVLDEVPGLKIKYDPSHSFVHGGDRGAYMEEGMMWGDRFGYVHIKGVIQYGDSDEVESWDRFELLKKHPELKDVLPQSFTHKNYDNPPAGLDSINWRAFFGVLYKYGFDGCCSIEPHSASWYGEKGDWGVKYTIKYIRSLMMDLNA